MGEVILMVGTAIAFVAGVFLVTTTAPGQPRMAGTGITGVLGLSVLLQLIGFVGRNGFGADALMFVATIAVCAALLGGVVWWMRRRQPGSPSVASSSRPAVHAYGTYNADTVRMRRGKGRY
jgi:predicted MFS family arabinose efflux permease